MSHTLNQKESLLVAFVLHLYHWDRRSLPAYGEMDIETPV